MNDEQPRFSLPVAHRYLIARVHPVAGEVNVADCDVFTTARRPNGNRAARAAAGRLIVGTRNGAGQSLIARGTLLLALSRRLVLRCVAPRLEPDDGQAQEK